MSNATELAQPHVTAAPSPFAGFYTDATVHAGGTLPYRMGRLTVTHADGFGGTARLNDVADGAPIEAVGLVSNVRLLGDDTAPRATFTLLSADAGSAIVAVATEAYLEFFGDLVQSHRIKVGGHVRRPFPDMPPFIQLAAVTCI